MQSKETEARFLSSAAGEITRHHPIS